MELIASAFQYGHHASAAYITVVSRRVRCQDFDFLQRFRGRVIGRKIPEGFIDVDAIEYEVIGLRAIPIHVGRVENR